MVEEIGEVLVEVFLVVVAYKRRNLNDHFWTGAGAVFDEVLAFLGATAAFVADAGTTFLSVHFQRGWFRRRDERFGAVVMSNRV